MARRFEDIVHASLAELLVEPGERLAEDVRPDLLLVVVDEGVADLVEQTEGDDLAGVGARRSAGGTFVQTRGQAPCGSELVDEHLAIGTEVAFVEVVPLTRRSPDPQFPHPEQDVTLQRRPPRSDG